MGLFDKKECDICGGKIGLLGNRKLEDGNCCKECASKLSPWLTGRKKMTVADIKQHLAYRQANENEVRTVNPNITIGNNTKVYVDQAQGKFFVTRSNNWRQANPDIIPLSQVTTCNVNVEEDRSEIYMKDNEGNNVSYVPPRYEYEYEFKVEIGVNSPYFNEIHFELSDNRPGSRYEEEYRRLEQQAEQLRQVLLGARYTPMGAGMAMGMNQGYVQQPMNQMGYQQPPVNQMGMNQGYVQQPMNQMGYQQPPVNQMGMNQGYVQQPMNQGYPQQNMNMGMNQQPMNQQSMNQGYVQQPQQQAGPQFCPYCGGPVNGGAFCPNCGAKME